MPRRIQDYPYAFAGWHSVASFGHLIVLAALTSFLSLLTHSAFYKRPLRARGHGLPFIATRAGYLATDKACASQAATAAQPEGARPVREHLVLCA